MAQADRVPNENLIRVGPGPDEIPLTDEEYEELVLELRGTLGDDNFNQLMGQIGVDEGAAGSGQEDAARSFGLWANSRPEFRELFAAGDLKDIATGLINFFKAMLGLKVPDTDSGSDADTKINDDLQTGPHA